METPPVSVQAPMRAVLLGALITTSVASEGFASASRPSVVLADFGPRFPRLRRYDQQIDWQANEIMKVLGRISETLTSTEYLHGFRIDEQKGVYHFDCSGLVHWVLRRAAPRAAAASAWGLAHRPLARDFQRRIASIRPDKPRLGWQRVARIADAQPGDVVAWLKPPIIESKNTGHVAFVVQPPLPVPGYEHAYLVRVADSTSLLHDEDTRGEGTGFGLGTILLIGDPETGAPLAYGWAGLRWRAFETKIAIGRPLS
jgi:hypothetical protein